MKNESGVTSDENITLLWSVKGLGHSCACIEGKEYDVHWWSRREKIKNEDILLHDFILSVGEKIPIQIMLRKYGI
jgi:hypothetical protein